MKSLLTAATMLAFIAAGGASAQTGGDTATTPGAPMPSNPANAATDPGTTSNQTLPPSVPPTSSGSSTDSGAVGPAGTSSETYPPGTTGQQAPGGRASGSTTGATGGR